MTKLMRENESRRGLLRQAMWLLAGLMLFMSAPSAMAEKRVALVIGNSKYLNTAALENPERDAEAIAAKLQSIGFDVTLEKDVTIATARQVLGAFSEKAYEADIAFVFYAGHGMEIDGTNYLIPVDAKLQSDTAARFEAVALDQIVYSVSTATKLSAVLLDACRNNPFATSMKRRSGTRAVSRGLASVEVEKPGMIISYAAREGTTADDGVGMHSPYTTALLDVLDKPGLEIGFMFRQVREQVKKATEGRQEPREYSALPDQLVYLVPPLETGTAPDPAGQVLPDPAADLAGQEVTPKPARDPEFAYLAAVQANTVDAYQDFLAEFPDHKNADSVRKIVRSITEENIWDDAKDADDVASYRRYLLVFPAGVYAAQAQAKIDAKTKVAVVTSPVIEVPKAKEPVAKQPETKSCPALNGPYRVVNIASTDTLNVRSGPGTKYQVLGEIPYKGSGVFVGKCADSKWCKVSYGCLSGYAAIKYLSDGTVSAPAPTATLYHVIDHPADDMLNVRSDAGTDSGIVGRLPYNASGVAVSACKSVSGYKSKWCVVKWNGISGWAYSRYLADDSGRNPG